MRKKLMLLCVALVAAFGYFQTCSFAADEEPPKNRLVFSKKFENIADNSWSNLEFPDDEQPPGLYYIELTELEGTVGCWGSEQNPYEDGPNGELLIAWSDGEPMGGNKDSDFRLQYRPTGGAWVELIVIAPQGAIGSTWYPFALQDAAESIGQTFIAPEAFTGVGLQTPTWVTNDSGCTISLYSAAEKAELASGPSPKDGALHEGTWVTLTWRAGALAVSHDVYLGEDFDEVSDATADSPVFRGNQGDTFTIAGFVGFPYPDGLVPGTSYYWRIDEVNDSEPNSPWKGDVWSFSVPPKTAYSPNPADGAEFVDLDADLSWTPGYGARIHTVYIGENHDDVDSAAGGTPIGAASYDPGTLEAEKVYYWRVDEFDAIETHKGDVWAFTTPGAVGNPQPANGAVDVQKIATLSWTAADSATSHELYFGTNADAVRAATAASPEYMGPKALGAESYDPGGLAWDSSYAWRVDEIYPDKTVKGLVWTFATADFLLVDDFESYNDIEPLDPNSNRIFDAWFDGYGTTTNGAVVGNDLPPYAEQTVVHGGAQSMPYRYDNSMKISEATLTLVWPRDWTEESVTKLSLWFRGDPTNSAERMFVALNGVAVVYNDDPASTQKTGWTEWVIELKAFADQGVSLTNVNTMAIGFGTKNAPAAGGTGTVYFDDVRLYR